MRFSSATVLRVLAAAACYYLATRIAWTLTFPDSKVSLFFPPHAILVSILLLVPTRHWGAYTLAAASAHFFATQQAHWPTTYALQCEAFDAAKYLLTAGGIRMFISSRVHRVSIREALLFVMIAVLVVPMGTALWGATFTVAYGFGTSYWVEWRNLSISNGVTAIVLVPAILIGVHRLSTRKLGVAPRRLLESACLAASIVTVGYVAFNHPPAGPNTSPTLLYAPIPLLIWAALRFGIGGMSASMLVITMMAVWGTMRGRGPFLTQTPEENALALQLFLLMVSTPLMLLAVAIEDERRSKEALRFSEARMSLAAESARLALWDWDVVNDRVWMTDEARKFLGFAPGEQVRFSDLGGRVHPDDNLARLTAIEEAVATSGAYESEYRIILPDGSHRWIAARGRLIRSESDAPPRVLGVAMDTTSEKQASAEARLQREELAHLARVASLSVLSASLAHELRQPLSSILINAQAGQRFMTQTTPDVGELREIFADIISADHRAGAIIESLRNMQRRGEVALQPVRVNESVEDLLDLTRSDLIMRGVSVTKALANNLPPATTDRVQLQQVLLNLIVNACDAMEGNAPGERTITITTSLARDEIHVGVLDRGVGLPEEVETLFQPFHTTKQGGLGMGLSICRTLVTAHGGRLWGERRPERGAAFHVALPVAREEIRPLSATAYAPVSQSERAAAM